MPDSLYEELQLLLKSLTIIKMLEDTYYLEFHKSDWLDIKTYEKQVKDYLDKNGFALAYDRDNRIVLALKPEEQK